jgi:hypothetical protein
VLYQPGFDQRHRGENGRASYPKVKARSMFAKFAPASVAGLVRPRKAAEGQTEADEGRHKGRTILKQQPANDPEHEWIGKPPKLPMHRPRPSEYQDSNSIKRRIKDAGVSARPDYCFC